MTHDERKDSPTPRETEGDRRRHADDGDDEFRRRSKLEYRLATIELELTRLKTLRHDQSRLREAIESVEFESRQREAALDRRVSVLNGRMTTLETR